MKQPIREVEGRLALAVEDLTQAIEEAKRVNDTKFVDEFIQLRFATNCQLLAWRVAHPALETISINETVLAKG